MSDLEKLAAKIDSEEAWKQSDWDDYDISSEAFTATAIYSHSTGKHIYNKTWWLEREVLRYNYGVYGSTEVTDMLNKGSYARVMVPHCSKDEPGMIAYTASTADGERDKQTRTTMGKFLRKYFITLTDKQIQELEQAHAAELSATFLRATGAKEIEHVYRTMAGDTGCMRYPKGHFDLQVHPSVVYESPGVSVAYIEKAGKVVSRSVIYDNPNDPTDKRWVRIYGAPMLKKILERNGYRNDDLCDVKLRKIKAVRADHSNYENQYVMPYLDGASGGTPRGGWIADLGDGWLTVVNGEFQKRASRAFGDNAYVVSARNSSAYLRVNELPKSEFVSDLSGITYNAMEHSIEYVWLEHSKTVGICADKEMRSFGYATMNGTTAYGYHGDKTVNVRIRSYENAPRFVHQGDYWLNTPEVKNKLGYRALWDKFYHDGEVGRPSEIYGVYSEDGETLLGYILRDDSIYLLTASGHRVMTHRDAIPELRKQGYRNTVAVGSRTTLIHRDRPTLRRTTTGAVVCMTEHSTKYVELTNGDVVSRNGAYSCVIFDKEFWYQQSGTNPYATIPLSKLLPLFKGTGTGILMDNLIKKLVPEGLDSTAVKMVKDKVYQLAMRYFESELGVTWTLTKHVETGKVVIGGYSHREARSLEQYAKVIAAWAAYSDSERQSHRDYDLLNRLTRQMETINTYMEGYIAMLDTLIEQKKLEEAGQVRLDAPEPEAESTAAPVAQTLDERIGSAVNELEAFFEAA